MDFDEREPEKKNECGHVRERVQFWPSLFAAAAPHSSTRFVRVLLAVKSSFCRAKLCMFCAQSDEEFLPLFSSLLSMRRKFLNFERNASFFVKKKHNKQQQQKSLINKRTTLRFEQARARCVFCCCSRCSHDRETKERRKRRRKRKQTRDGKKMLKAKTSVAVNVNIYIHNSLLNSCFVNTRQQRFAIDDGDFLTVITTTSTPHYAGEL